MKTNSKGFTLIELLVVITIITILATISIPQFAKYRIRAYNAAAISDLRNAKVELEGYYLDVGHNYQYPQATGCPTSMDNTGKYTGGCLESVGGFDFRFSNRVLHNYIAETAGQAYYLATKSFNGDMLYGSSSTASRIYYAINTTDRQSWVGVTIGSLTGKPTEPTAGDVKTASDGWFTSKNWNIM